MPLLQGQPFRLIKAPETIPSGAELYVIQHTGEKFLVKSDYEDRLALYSQSIWTCQCSGKSGLTHQEAWTSESKVRVMLSSSFPAPLWSPILHCIHHSTQPLDQLVETTSALCLSKFHPGEELTYLNPTTQVRVVSSRAAPDQPEINDSNPEKPDSSLEKPKAEDSQSSSPVPTLTNGCTNNNQDGAPSLNGTSNGSAAMEEGSPSSSTKPKEDSPGRKKGMLSLLYDVVVIDEDRKIKDVPSKDLQRTYKIPPKEHFRLFIRANALRQRASAFTPWIVSEDLVKQYDIPSKLASVFTQPSFNFSGKKRKLDQPVEKVKKQKSEDTKKIKTEKEKIKKEPKDTNAPKKKPGTKSGVKRTLKVELNKVESLPVKSEMPVKMETSDSDDDISLAALASKSPKLEANNTDPKKTPVKVETPKPVKRETEKDSLPNKKMKQATLFDMKSSKSVAGSGTSGSPKKSPQKRVISSETVMRMPVMRRLLHQRKMYKGVRGMGRKIVYIMDQALNKLSLKHIAAISDQELQEELMKRREKVMEKRILATMSAEDREAYLKQKSLEEKKKKQETKFVQTLKIREENRKLEDKILKDLKPLPAPKLVPTPEEIPNSLFGDITMIIEFIECYREIVLTDKKNSISSQHLIQALTAGKEGFKFISEIMVLLLHIIIDDERIGDNKELGVKLSELAVHYQTAMELARLCLSKGGSSDTASQHSDDHEYEEECELSEGLLKKLDTHELYELQAEEIIEVLRALCHRAMASYTCLEYFEDIDEKATVLHRQFLQIKKENNKQELLKKKEKREELLKKKKEKTMPSPKKTPGRPKKPSNTLENFIKKEEPAKEAEEEEESPDIISVVKRKRMTADELQKEKEEQSKEMREKQLKEEEEMRKQQIILAWEKVNLQKEALARLQPLGVDRNHDRYWLFNCTTPGLYVEKGWVDVNTTYCVKSASPRKDAVNGQLEMEKPPDVVSPSLASPTSEKDPKTVVHTPTLASPGKDVPEPIPMSNTPSNMNGTGLGISQSPPAVNSTTEKNISVNHVSSNARAVSSSVTSISGPLIQPTQDKPSSTDNKTVSSSCGSKLVHGTGSENGITSVLLSSKSEKSDCVQELSSASKNNVASFEPISDGLKAPQSNVAIVNTSDTKKSEEDLNKHDQNETIRGLSVSSVGAVSSQQMSSPRTLASVILPDCDSDSDEKPLAAVKKKLELEADDRPLSDVKRQLELEAEDKPLSLIKKELSESPTKTPGRPRGRPPKPKDDTPPRPRGRPPKERLPGEEKIQRPRGRPPKPKTPDGTPVKDGEESPGTGRPRGRPKAFRLINDDETFPPVGQNMWFYYNTLEEIDSLLESLAAKGLRESKLKTAIMQAKKQMETNFVKEWQPLEDLVDGSVQLLETLREDIIQIEKELNEGWLGSVPELEAWEKKANEATTIQELGECLIEAQRHIQIKFLKGIMKPVRKPIPTENPEAQQEYEEVEGSAVQHWRDAVSNCSTLSRLHLLVGMFDSCIKWEKSMATKKCKVCRAQDTSVPLAICDKCEGSYHWRCLRPQLTEEPPEPWYCPGCQPNKKERRKITRNQDEEEREEPLTTEFKQEKICRVCERGIGLIFCSKCPAAYHSECHDPPLQTRARKDWKCVDCQKPRSRSSRAAASAKQEALKIKEPSKKESRSNSKSVVSKESTSRRSSSRSKYTEVEEDEDEEEEPGAEESSENDDSHDEDFSTRRKSTRVRKTVNPPRRTTSRSVKKRSYKIESEEEEEEDEEELVGEEEEEQEGSEDEQVEEEEQGSDDDQEEEDEEEQNEDDDEKDDDDDEEEGKEVDEDDEDEDSEVERDEEEEDDDNDNDDDDDDDDDENDDENQDEKEEDDTEED